MRKLTASLWTKWKSKLNSQEDPKQKKERLAKAAARRRINSKESKMQNQPKLLPFLKKSIASKFREEGGIDSFLICIFKKEKKNFFSHSDIWNVFFFCFFCFFSFSNVCSFKTTLKELEELLTNFDKDPYSAQCMLYYTSQVNLWEQCTGSDEERLDNLKKNWKRLSDKAISDCNGCTVLQWMPSISKSVIVVCVVRPKIQEWMQAIHGTNCGAS